MSGEESPRAAAPVVPLVLGYLYSTRVRSS